MHGMDGTLNGALRRGPAILNKLVSMGKLRKMARSYQVNGKGVQGVVEVTILAYGRR